jgi:large subunit ribosomal protein L29
MVMKAQEIRDLSEKERQDRVTDLGQEIFNLRFQLATGKIENPSRLKSLRRDIARIKTIQGEAGVDSPEPAKETSEEKK